MKVLIDTNVLLDFFQERADHEDASRILSLAARRRYTMCVAAHTITTLGYFLKKTEAYPGEFRERLQWLFGICRVLPVDDETIKEALPSPISDFEDAVMECSAFRHEIDNIVTRDKKGFKHSRVPALSPSAFLKLVANGEGSRDIVRESAPSYRTRPRRRRKAAVETG